MYRRHCSRLWNWKFLKSVTVRCERSETCKNLLYVRCKFNIPGMEKFSRFYDMKSFQGQAETLLCSIKREDVSPVPCNQAMPVRHERGNL